MATISRRDFVKYAGGGIAALVVGSRLSWVFQNPQFAAAQVFHTIDFEIGDAIKQMVTHNTLNNAECYFWVYKHVTPVTGFPTGFPAEVPGPHIFASVGDTVTINVTNRLDEDHAFFIPGIPGVNAGLPIADTGAIPPGQTRTVSFTLTGDHTGSHLYFDNLNAPVNRVMGLHGALHVHPVPGAVGGHQDNPYGSRATPAVQKLFDDFGAAAHFPGLAWGAGDAAADSFAPAFRTYVWLDHQASPVLFQEVGQLAAGVDMDPQVFVERFLRDPVTTGPTNRRAQYFTISGQSGHFSHGSPFICPNLRVGEPCVVHILNAGLWTHAMHVHANHFYVTFVDGVVMDNPLWLDTFEVEPGERVDYVLPYVRPPDIPNVRGIGLPDAPLTTVSNALIPGSAPHPAWPATEELSFAIPQFSIAAAAHPGAIATPGAAALTALAADGVTAVDLGVQLSPMCYPMHDHSEPSQTSQGGNYNLGLIAGMNFTGDRNIDSEIPGGFTPPAGSGIVKSTSGVVTFPNAPDMFPPNATGLAAPPPPFGHGGGV